MDLTDNGKVGSREGGIIARVLLVDDVASNLTALARFLRKVDADVVMATSGAEALSLMRQQQFALVLLDVMMPDMDGYETAHRMRQDPDIVEAPVIFITGVRKKNENIFNGYRVGAADYLIKPVDPEIVRSKVQVFVTLYRQQQEILRKSRELARLRERQELEKDLRKMRTMDVAGVLVGGMLHDFNNLLMGIMGNIELARMISEADRRQQILDQGLRGVKAAHALTSYLGIYARGGEPLVSSLDMNELLVEVFDPLAEKDGIDLRYQVEELAPVWADREQIRLVLNNVAANALEAMADGGVLTVRGAMVAERHLRVAVIDNGCGVAAEIADHAFDPYFSSKERGSQKGMGMGLPLCYAIISRHGGHIDFRSQPGKGREVEFFLPYGRKPDQPELQSVIE